ncbi:MAG TPA: phosphoribosylformylglycinamidine synthase, partial [Thermodesulfovibrionales bacterium]|nr:phosphoribosylformylglycinamidine synthase [Thermodesulfovibrionales bacterium]
MPLISFYRRPVLSENQKESLLSTMGKRVPLDVGDIQTEYCFYIESSQPLTPAEKDILEWLLRETFEPHNLSSQSFLGSGDNILEVGPRMNFTTAWSTNAVSVCNGCGLSKVSRIERSRRYSLVPRQKPGGELERCLADLIHDRMTECPYGKRLTSFDSGIHPEPVREVKILEEGRTAIEKINRELGLGLDEWDINYYYLLFANDMKRNPTNVECFDLSQSNSEHSRHWFFKGKLIIDGTEVPQTLMEIIKEPYRRNPNNSVIAFSDNSSAIKGYRTRTILPVKPGSPSPFTETEKLYHLIFTAETHNFPSGVAPFPGAETGTGGRIRDVQAVGRGGLVVAGTAAYCV